MKKKRTRSLYLGRSLLEDITRASRGQRRTISQQICLLIEIALASSSMSMGSEDGFVDDTKGRVYVYLEPSLDRRVNEVRDGMGESVSYSACVRALVMVGAAIQRRMGCRLCGVRKLGEKVDVNG